MSPTPLSTYQALSALQNLILRTQTLITASQSLNLLSEEYRLRLGPLCLPAMDEAWGEESPILMGPLVREAVMVCRVGITMVDQMEEMWDEAKMMEPGPGNRNGNGKGLGLLSVGYPLQKGIM